MERLSKEKTNKFISNKKIVAALVFVILISLFFCDNAYAKTSANNAYTYVKFTNIDNEYIKVFESANGKGKTIKPIKNGKHKGCYKLKAGVHRYKTSKKGYVITEKAFRVKKTTKGKTVKMKVKLTPESKVGYQSKVQYRLTASIESKFFSLKNTECNLKFNTPAFTNKNNRFSSYDELVSYVQEKCTNSSNLYYFEGENDIPVIIFSSTNLDNIESLEEALTVLNSDEEKMNIFYQAQIHGNEPASSEAALLIIRDLSKTYGSTIKNNVNLVIVPRVNEYGAKEFVRKDENGIDLNRDNLKANSSTTVFLQKIFNIYRPELIVDAHECLYPIASEKSDLSKIGTKGINLYDVKISALSTPNIDETVKSDSIKLADVSKKKCIQSGLSVKEYGVSYGNSIGRNYYAMYDTNYILVESTGIGMGKANFKKRVFSQYTAVKSVIDYCNNNSSKLKSDVILARENLLKEMSEYNLGKAYVLEYKGISNTAKKGKRFRYYVNGKVTKSTKVDYIGVKSVKTRKYPTAYIIPQSAEGAKTVIEALIKRGVIYYEKTLTDTINLQEYQCENNEYAVEACQYDNLGEVYIIPTSQFHGRIITTLLEPDVSISHDGDDSFIQRGIISYKNIFRYTDDCKNLIEE